MFPHFKKFTLMDESKISQADYNTWLNNEYALWQSALQEIPFHKFKHHPQVIRMMGLEDDHLQFVPLIKNLPLPWEELQTIDQIGSPQQTIEVNGVKLSGVCLRFIYYADKVLDQVKDPGNIRLAEIGGGYAGFYAVICAIAFHRKMWLEEYAIFDLPQVLDFQAKYIRAVVDSGAIVPNKMNFYYSPDLSIFKNLKLDYIMSFYALGEFADKAKGDYIEHIISKVPHGLILWNPHSGSGNSLDLLRSHRHNITVEPEYPLTSENNLQVSW